MQQRTANIILIPGDLESAYQMAWVLTEMFSNMGISGKAHAYYEDWYIDEAVKDIVGIEYGVQVVVNGLSPQMWRGFLEAVSQPIGDFDSVVVREK